MTLLRMPVLSWAQVATTLMVRTSFPALLLAIALLFAGRHLSPVFDTPGGPAAYQHLFWFYGHPVDYVAFFPFLAAAACSRASAAGGSSPTSASSSRC